MPRLPKIDTFTPEQLAEIVQKSTNQKEALRALGYTGAGASYKLLKDRCQKYNISMKHFAQDYHSKATTITEEDLCKNSTRATTNIKSFILRNNLIPYKCAFCGNKGEWQGKELILQLDHIDGDNTNHSKENLRFLCPNCHTQTKTWGRNKDNN